MSTSDMINSGSEFGEVQKRTFPSWLETQLETPSRGEAVAAQRDDVLGIRLKVEVLPLSNLQGYLPPFVLAPSRAFARRQ